MNWDFTVLKQWFALLLSESELQKLSPQWIIDKLTSLTYPEKEIWIKEGIYIPSTGVLQVVAVVPKADYVDSDHVAKEQFVRVMSQAICLVTLLSPDISGGIKQIMSDEYDRNVYYVQETTRWRRLVRPDDPFVVTVRIQSVRRIRKDSEDRIFSIDFADGAFEGNVRGAYLPGHSQAICSEGLEKYCCSIWQTLAGSLASKLSFMLAKRQLERKTTPINQTAIAY